MQALSLAEQAKLLVGGGNRNSRNNTTRTDLMPPPPCHGFADRDSMCWLLQVVSHVKDPSAAESVTHRHTHILDTSTGGDRDPRDAGEGEWGRGGGNYS